MSRKKERLPEWNPDVVITIKASCEIHNFDDFRSSVKELLESIQQYGSIDVATMEITRPKSVDLLKDGL